MQNRLNFQTHRGVFKSPVTSAKARLRLEAGKFEPEEPARPTTLDELQRTRQDQALALEANKLLEAARADAKAYMALDNSERDANLETGIVARAFDGFGDGVICQFEKEKSGNTPTSLIFKNHNRSPRGFYTITGDRAEGTGALLLEANFNFKDHIYEQSRSFETGYNASVKLERIEGDIFQIEFKEELGKKAT